MKKYFGIINFVDEDGNTSSIELRVKAENVEAAERKAYIVGKRFEATGEELCGTFFSDAGYASKEQYPGKRYKK